MDNRRFFIRNKVITLAEYLPADHADSYNDWLDKQTQKAYNFKFDKTFEEYANQQIDHRLYASIFLNKTNKLIGIISISPDETAPNIAIRIFKPYRNRGYGTQAFHLGIEYAFETLKLPELHAQCYYNNIASIQMLTKCGFLPNPQGDVQEIHFLTGKEVIKLDNVLVNKVK